MRRVLPLLFLCVAACDSKPAAPPPTPTPRPTPVAKVVPAATPVDPSLLPPSHRADAATLPQNVASSLAFIQMMLKGPTRSTMDKVTCHCCGKTLAQCYVDTATKAAKACSPL